MDLRELVAACRIGDCSIAQVAAQFSVPVSFVNKLLKRQRTRGTVVALPHAGGPVPLHNGPNVTVIAALKSNGFKAVMKLNGTVNAEAFAVYLDQVLGPTLVPGDVVVLDNLRVHKAPGLAELVEKRGARLLFLSP